MKHLYMKFNNGSELEADIIENEFTDAFCELFQVQKKCGKKLADTKIGYWRQTPKTFDKVNWPAGKILDQKRHLVNNINQAIANIKTEFGLEFPRPHAFVEMGQAECNLIHRCFTTSEMRFEQDNDGTLTGILWKFKDTKHKHLIEAKRESRDWFCNQLISLDDFVEPTINGPTSRFQELVHIINRDIHNFESLVETSNKHKILDILKERDSWHITQRFDIRADNGCGQIMEKDQNFFKQSWRQYCSFDKHDIWLLKDVLGKDYHQCWLDEDDPTNVDICNIDLRHSAAVCIEHDNGHNQFLNSPEFISWLRGYGIQFTRKVIANVPIADISNGWNMHDYMDDVRPNAAGEHIKTIEWDIQ